VEGDADASDDDADVEEEVASADMEEEERRCFRCAAMASMVGRFSFSWSVIGVSRESASKFLNQRKRFCAGDGERSYIHAGSSAKMLLVL